MFQLIDLTKNGKIGREAIEKFLIKLRKTGDLTKDISDTPIDKTEKLIQVLSFDKDGLISEDEVIEEMFKNDSYANFISSFESEQNFNFS